MPKRQAISRMGAEVISQESRIRAIFRLKKIRGYKVIRQFKIEKYFSQILCTKKILLNFVLNII